MGLMDIIKGHLNELTDKHKDMSEERMEICEQCPLYSEKPYGLVCDNSLWLNPETNETSTFAKRGFHRGCGCRLKAKTTLRGNHCPANKW